MKTENKAVNSLVWKPCPRFDGYDVSCFGDLRSRSGKRLKGYITCDGYIAYRIGKTEVTAHVLVLEAFVGMRPSETHQGAHNDGSRLHNHPDNLRWATPLENQQDRKVHRTSSQGEGNGRAKITDEDVVFIRSEYRNIKASRGKRKVTELEERFGLHRATIVDIAMGRTWQHVVSQ